MYFSSAYPSIFPIFLNQNTIKSVPNGKFLRTISDTTTDLCSLQPLLIPGHIYCFIVIERMAIIMLLTTYNIYHLYICLTQYVSLTNFTLPSFGTYFTSCSNRNNTNLSYKLCDITSRN